MPLMLRWAVAAAATAISVSPTPSPSSTPTSLSSSAQHREHLPPTTTIAIVVSIGLLVIFLGAHCILIRTCRSYAIFFGKQPPPSKKALGKRRASGEQIEMWRREAGGNPPFKIIDGEAIIVDRSNGGSEGLGT